MQIRPDNIINVAFVVDEHEPVPVYVPVPVPAPLPGSVWGHHAQGRMSAGKREIEEGCNKTRMVKGEWRGSGTGRVCLPNSALI